MSDKRKFWIAFVSALFFIPFLMWLALIHSGFWILVMAIPILGFALFTYQRYKNMGDGILLASFIWMLIVFGFYFYMMICLGASMQS